MKKRKLSTDYIDHFDLVFKYLYASFKLADTRFIPLNVFPINLLLPFINMFNKAEAAIFPMHGMLLQDFSFFAD